jgi:ribosomal protein S18 acetylase RimI-like enzyme
VAVCEIRLLDADDWALWRDVRLRSLADVPDAFGSKLAEWQGDGDREDRWRSRFDNVAFNAVAVSDNGVVGTLGAMAHSPGTVELISMWVAPEVRGTGVGEALIDAVLVWAAAESVERVVLAVRRGNDPALALYTRCGFVLVGPNPNDDTEDLMAWRG